MTRRSRRRGVRDDDATRAARAAAAGDAAAAERFASLTVVDVWRFCAGLVDPESADDLTQVTYERALGALERFRGEASARTWLLSIARRVCADEIRARTRHRRLDDDLYALAPPAAARGDFTDHSALHALVGELPPERREAFVLTQMLGLAYEEAAAVSGCAVGTIRSRVARARRELRAHLDPESRGPVAEEVPRVSTGRGRRAGGAAGLRGV